MKDYLIYSVLLILMLCHFIGCSASDMPQNGHDWHSMPKSERIEFCSALISGKESLENYPSDKVKLAAQYLSGRINYYYENHSIDLDFGQYIAVQAA